MNPADAWVLRDAAAMLEADAQNLRQSHTIRGEWPTRFAADEILEEIAKAEHDKMLATATRLREIADRR